MKFSKLKSLLWLEIRKAELPDLITSGMRCANSIKPALGTAQIFNYTFRFVQKVYVCAERYDVLLVYAYEQEQILCEIRETEEKRTVIN